MYGEFERKSGSIHGLFRGIPIAWRKWENLPKGDSKRDPTEI
jgi:hypothetical protein